MRSRLLYNRGVIHLMQTFALNEINIITFYKMEATMKKILVTLLLITLSMTAFAAAQQEKQVLRIYTAFDTEEAQYYIDAFEKKDINNL